MINNVVRSIAVVLAGLALAVAGALVVGSQASAHESRLRAVLHDPTGRMVGTAEFRIRRHAMTVDARLRRNDYVTPSQFHGFHVHANNDPVNGNGCLADSKAPASTWFISADGHLSATGQSHGAHRGDLPSPLVMADGTARLQFTTDRIDPELLRGRVVILHANPDNFGNIPAGSEANQYTPNSPAASDLTARTGNASNRVACGMIRQSR